MALSVMGLNNLKFYAVFLALLMAAPFSVFAQSGESSFVRFTTQNNQVYVDYFLDEQGKVFENILGALRAGEGLRVTYLSEIRQPGGWFKKGEILGRAVAFHFIDYDPISNLFSLRQNLNNKIRYNLRREDLEQIMFRQYDLPLVEAEKLKSKKEYSVFIKISFDSLEEEGSLLNIFALKPLWQKQKMEAEVLYIAP